MLLLRGPIGGAASTPITSESTPPAATRKAAAVRSTPRCGRRARPSCEVCTRSPTDLAPIWQLVQLFSSYTQRCQLYIMASHVTHCDLGYRNRPKYNTVVLRFVRTLPSGVRSQRDVGRGRGGARASVQRALQRPSTASRAFCGCTRQNPPQCENLGRAPPHPPVLGHASARGEGVRRTWQRHLAEPHGKGNIKLTARVRREALLSASRSVPLPISSLHNGGSKTR